MPASCTQREDDLKGRRQLEAMDEIEAEVDNLRLAWYQALEDQDMARIEQAAFPLTSYAEFRSRQVEFVLWLADAEQALRGQYAGITITADCWLIMVGLFTG